jgi:dienelactone hydrolase
MRWIVGFMLCGAVAASGAQSALSERLTHQYWSVTASPDGRWVADIEGDSPLGGYHPALRDLVIRRVQDGMEVRVQLPCGRVPECWPDSPTWSHDGKHVSFTLRTPGSHARTIYQVEPDGSALTQVLEFNGTIQALRYLPDGRLSMLATQDARKEVGATEAGTPIAGDLDATPPEQRIAVLEQGALRFVSPADLYVYEYDAAGSGSFVGTAAHGDGDNNYWTAKLYAFSDGEARVIYAPAGNQQQLAAPKVSRDGGSVAFIAGLMSDFGSVGGDVFLLSLKGGTPINLTPEMHASARALGWRCDGHLEAELLAGNETQIVELDSRDHRQPPKLLWSAEESFGRRADPLSPSCPSNLRAMVHESFTSPPEIAVGSLDHTRDLTHGNAGLKLDAHVQSVWWKNDGFDVQGWLLLPEKHGSKLPLVTQVHGGPAAAATPSFIGPGTQRSLLEHGYALFYPNPRGSYGQGERFTRANVRDFGYGDLRDILAGIDAAAKVAPIDLDRLGLTGGSYGGFMTMWAVTQTNRFKAAVAGAGISDWLSYYGENGIDAWMIPYFGASAYDDPAAYARSSAIHYMHNVKTPTFAYVGERDIECPAAQTQEFWHAMKAMNVPTEVMIYPGEGHGLRDPKHLEDETRRTLEWFDRYLK